MKSVSRSFAGFMIAATIPSPHGLIIHSVSTSKAAPRKAKDGVLIEPWAIKESALEYLCDEYAMRSLMRERFGFDEIYLGLAVTQADLFQRENPKPEIDLTLPTVRPITLHDVKMVHVEEIGAAVPANDERVPDYARDLGMALHS